MVRIPYIKIPSARVGSIGPTSNIGTGGATPAPPIPITYLTQWRLMGNSEVHWQEIWSCGEYNATDGKYHILVQPQGGSIADIALDEPLRKTNDVADTIEFADSVATLTRNIKSVLVGNCSIYVYATNTPNVYCWRINDDARKKPSSSGIIHNVISNKFETVTANNNYTCIEGVSVDSLGRVIIFDPNFTASTDANNFKNANADVEVIYEVETPTTETIQVPQIQEADSYSCVISQGSKAVEWSDFETNSE